MMLGRSFLNQFPTNQLASDPLLKINFNKPPISDLHVHFDGGTLTKQIIETLAKRNNISIPEELASRLFRQDGSIRYIENDFSDFLKTYDIVSDFIRTPNDYCYVAYEYLKACAHDGAIYVELMFSPDHAKLTRQKFGAHNPISSNNRSSDAQEYSYHELIDAIAQGIDEARKNFGIDSRIVIALLRHNGFHGCESTMDDILSYCHPYVVGIDLVGDEVNYPPEHFIKIYERAKQAGFKTAIHVGEHAPASSITTALNQIAPHRISHGNTAINDPTLVAYLAHKRIGLTMCLTSNLRLGVCPCIEDHPLDEHDAGVTVYTMIDPNEINPSLIKEIVNNEEQLFLEYEAIYQYGLLEKIDHLPGDNQDHGNCALQSHREAIRGLLYFELLNQGYTTEQAHQYAETYFQEWNAFFNYYTISHYFADNVGLGANAYADIFLELNLEQDHTPSEPEIALSQVLVNALLTPDNVPEFSHWLQEACGHYGKHEMEHLFEPYGVDVNAMMSLAPHHFEWVLPQHVLDPLSAAII